MAKHKQEDKVYAVKVLTKAAIRKRNEVSKKMVLEIPSWDVKVYSVMYITG